MIPVYTLSILINMKLNFNKAFFIKILIIYMINALLFLSSIELHIHTKETASYASHGSAVSITALSNDLADMANEIEVSPDGMLHAQHNIPNLLVIFLLLTLIIIAFNPISISRIKDTHTPSELPFYGTPLLRAPPQ